LDVIAINAFYPLADQRGAPEAVLSATARAIRDKIHSLAETWRKPVLFAEIGYTTRTDPAVRPWEWPDTMTGVSIDETAQAAAYRALLAPMLDEPDFAGFFVWRVYADPDDTSQEAPWGFSPRGKMAELVVREAFAAGWAVDPWWRTGWGVRALTAGPYP
jgi:arabinogalactan endo-1,4-beta-galactosidase